MKKPFYAPVLKFHKEHLKAVFFPILFLVFAVYPNNSLAEESKPLIGINMDIQDENKNPEIYRIQKKYVQALAKSGGIPILIPPTKSSDIDQILSRLDGIMLIGGPDYPPEFYGEKAQKSVHLMSKTRSNFDRDLARALLKRKRFPILGICAGSQILNIVSGGSLVQHIPKQYPDSKLIHASRNGWTKGFNRHEVKLKPKSKIKAIYSKENITVVTSHHQAVKKLGKGMKVGARSEDGVIEAIESKNDRYLIGLQWHPERDYKTNSTLFKNFVEQCKSYHAKK